MVCLKEHGPYYKARSCELPFPTPSPNSKIRATNPQNRLNACNLLFSEYLIKTSQCGILIFNVLGFIWLWSILNHYSKNTQNNGIFIKQLFIPKVWMLQYMYIPLTNVACNEHSRRLKWRCMLVFSLKGKCFWLHFTLPMSKTAIHVNKAIWFPILFLG